MSRIVPIGCLSVAACAAVMSAHAAQASNCAQVIAAIRNADTQQRFAQYIVSSPDRSMTGEPMVIRVDGTMYTNIGPNWQSDPAGPNPVLGRIQAAESHGTGKCQSAGPGMVRGMAVEKVRYNGPLIGSSAGSYTLWVDKASGLPLYHETSALPVAGGIAWKYGSSVQPPTNVRSGGIDFSAILKGLPNVMNSATGGKKP